MCVSECCVSMCTCVSKHSVSNHSLCMSKYYVYMCLCLSTLSVYVLYVCAHICVSEHLCVPRCYMYLYLYIFVSKHSVCVCVCLCVCVCVSVRWCMCGVYT